MDAIPEFTRDLLVSLHPRHASNILSGEKTVELRRRFPEQHIRGALALIYSTTPVQAIVGVARIKHVAQPVQAPLAELVRVSGEHGIGLFVDGANYDDVARDKDETRRAVTLSKLAKFQQLGGIPLLAESALVARFGAIKNDHDRSDVRFLAALDAKAVDFVVSQDIGLHRRGQRAGLGANVFTIEEALQWVKRLFGVKAVNLPSIVQRKAYEIDKSDAIFESLRADYPDFDAWFNKCRKEHRECWVLELDGDIAGLIIRKNETHAQADTEGFGPKILKICTFKVRDEFLGEKYGELLLKQVLWFAAVVFRPRCGALPPRPAWRRPPAPPSPPGSSPAVSPYRWPSPASRHHACLCRKSRPLGHPPPRRPPAWGLFFATARGWKIMAPFTPFGLRGRLLFDSVSVC